MTFSDIIPARNQHRQSVLQPAHQGKSVCMGVKALLPLLQLAQFSAELSFVQLNGKLEGFLFFFSYSPIRPTQKMSTCQKNTNSIPTPGIIKDRIITPKEKAFWDDTDVSFDSGRYCGLLCEGHQSPFLTFMKLLSRSETAGLKLKQKAWSIKEHYQPRTKIQPQWNSSL